jgi:hypothetical protein
MREISLKRKYIKSAVYIFILWENLSKKIILTILAVKLKAGFTAFLNFCPVWKSVSENFHLEWHLHLM